MEVEWFMSGHIRATRRLLKPVKVVSPLFKKYQSQNRLNKPSVLDLFSGYPFSSHLMGSHQILMKDLLIP